MRKRWKRKSGYVTPDLTISMKDLIKYDLFVIPIYDDWCDYRDSMRDCYSDSKKIKKRDLKIISHIEDLHEKIIKSNKKQKKLLKRRKAMKCSRR